MSSPNLKVTSFWLETKLLNLSAGPQEAWPSSQSPAQAQPRLRPAPGPLHLPCAFLKFSSHLWLSACVQVHTHTHTHVQALTTPTYLTAQFSSVTQSCLTLCDPMGGSTPGFPVHHQLPELAQAHVHQVRDASQPSHPLSSIFLLPSVFFSIWVFSNESVLRISWPKYWSFSVSISPSNEHPGLTSFRWTGWISLQSKGLSRVFSSTTVQKHHFLTVSL